MSPTGGRGHDRKGRQSSATPPVRPGDATPAGDAPTPIVSIPALSTAPMGASAVTHTNTMTISSDYGEAREVQRQIHKDVERSGFDDDSQFAIKLAIEEAIINAIKHGNKLDRSKQVHVEWRVSPQTAEFIVEDEGPGFTRTAIPNPTDEPNLEKLTGRGILLMEAYMNHVEWSQGGRRVRLVKHNQRQVHPLPRTA